MTATNVMFRETIPTFRRIASRAMRRITMQQQIPTTFQPELTMFAWSVTPPCPDGNRLNSQFMMVCFFPYIQKSTVVNGAVALNAIATLRITQYSPVSIAMSTTGLIWMTNIRVRMDMNIQAWPAWIATPQEDTNKKQYEKFITDPIYSFCWPQ